RFARFRRQRSGPAAAAPMTRPISFASTARTTRATSKCRETTKISDHYNVVDHFLDRHVREGRGEKLAITCEAHRLSYAQTAEQVNRAGNRLRELGIEEEQRVMLLLPDIPEFAIAYFAVMKIGAIAVPTNISCRADDYAYFLNESRARALIVHSSVYAEVA